MFSVQLTLFMPSELGIVIRRARLEAGIGLRELARRIEKSPSYLVLLERSEVPPGSTEETLTSIAKEIGLSMDVLATLTAKVPTSLRPRTPVEVELYRTIRALSPERQKVLLDELKGESSTDTTEPTGGRDDERG